MPSTIPNAPAINFNSAINPPAPAVPNGNFKLTPQNMLGGNFGTQTASGGVQSNIPQYSQATINSGLAGNGAISPVGYNTNGSFGVPNNPTVQPNPNITSATLVQQNNTPQVANGGFYSPAQLATMNSAPTKPVTATVPSTVNTSVMQDTTGSSYGDLLKSIGDNVNAYSQNMQNNAQEQAAHNSYIQALQNQQNYQLSLSGGQLAQYGVGRPLALDTGRAAQLGFNNQLNTQNFQNATDVAQRNEQFALSQQQLQAQTGQNTVQDYLSLGNQALTQQQLAQQMALGTLPYGSMTADQKAALGLQYYQATGTMPDFSSTGGSTGSASGSTQPTYKNGLVSGYDLSTYSTDPGYSTDVAQRAAQIQQSIGTYGPQGIQSYIQSQDPTSTITGQMITNAIQQNPVDASVLLAMMQKESSFGTSSVATANNNPGGIKFVGQANATQGTPAPGGTDGGNYAHFLTMQDGVNAMAGEIASRYSPNGNSSGSAPSDSISQVQSFLPPTVSQAVQSMPNGIPYINLDLVPSGLQTMVNTQAALHGVKAFTSDEVSGLESLGAVSQALNGMTQLVSQQLNPSNGGIGTLGNVIKNAWGSWSGTNPALAQFQTYSDSAIKSVQALAGGQGSGLRLNTGTISNAVNNLPTQNDSLEVALQKIATLRTLLNNQMGQIFGNSDLSKGVAQYNGQTLMPGDVVGNINGQTGTVNTDGTITPNQ